MLGAVLCARYHCGVLHAKLTALEVELLGPVKGVVQRAHEQVQVHAHAAENEQPVWVGFVRGWE